MIYSRGHFCFIHIPRTAGLSITTSLARAITLSEDHFSECVIATSSEPAAGDKYYRHATASELQDAVPEWDSIKKFAIYRQASDIIKSDYRLHLSRNPDDTRLCPLFRESIREARRETLEQFAIRRWNAWLVGSDPWDFWAGPNFRKFEFSSIREDWPGLLDWLGLPYVPLIHVNSA